LCAYFIRQPPAGVVKDIILLTRIVSDGVIVGDVTKVGVNDEACPMGVGEVNNNIDGIIQERFDAAIMREPCGNVIVSVCTCGGDELREEECVEPDV